MKRRECIIVIYTTIHVYKMEFTVRCRRVSFVFLNYAHLLRSLVHGKSSSFCSCPSIEFLFLLFFSVLLQRSIISYPPFFPRQHKFPRTMILFQKKKLSREKGEKKLCPVLAFCNRWRRIGLGKSCVCDCCLESYLVVVLFMIIIVDNYSC